MLLIDVLRSCVAAGKFRLHDFVIMPDHIHVVIEVDVGMSIEKAMQLIKGGFSYRLKKENGYLGEVWQLGFSEVRIYDDRSLIEHCRYIAENPLKAGLCVSTDEYPYCFAFLAKRKREQGLKPNK
jgi:putative transposase